MYANAETLWQTTIAENPNSWMAYNNLGSTLSEQNNILGQHADSAMCVLVDNGKQFYCVDFASGWQLLGVGTRI